MIGQGHTLVEDASRQLGQEVSGNGKQDRAVSPDTRPIDRINPVMIFGKAIGNTTLRMVCNLVAPQCQTAVAEKESSMLLRASSVVRIISGKDISARVNEPAMMESPQPQGNDEQGHSE